MSLQKIQSDELLELSTDWRVTLSVAFAKLIVFVPIWSYALWQFDDPRIDTRDPFVFNLRLAFFLYLLEHLVGLYRGRYVPNLTPRQAWNLVAKEVPIAAGKTLAFTIAGCVVRWGLVAGFTALLIKLPSPTTWTTALAAILPTVVVTACSWWQVKASEGGMPKGTVRGTHIGSYGEAVAKAAALRSQAG